MRRRYSPEHKARFVLLCFGSKQAVATHCRELNISSSNYYAWRKKFVQAGMKAFARPVKRPRNPSIRISTKKERGTLESVEINLLLRSFKVLRARQIPSCPRTPEAVQSEIINLIESASILKRDAIALAGLPRSTFYGWRKRLRMNSLSPLHDAALIKVKLTDRDDIKSAVFRALHAPPKDYGFNRTTWRAADLQSALRGSGVIIGTHAIRKIIKSAGYRWLKARKVLTSKDPDYRAKLDNIHRILRGLGTSDGFFSIDEYGPFAVKYRQGLRLVAPGETASVPQWQKSKGTIIITAAVELATNQVTHFYSEKKNTAEMIKLLDILLQSNPHLQRVYLSWDAASWHVSKKLFEHIESNNVMASVTGSPHVEVAPLPAGAQFLNVIEAIFSGMARAVVHNSNYESKAAAQSAFDRYFSERNEAFLKNPRRAGKRIWGEERQTIAFSEANNCKDPAYR